MSAHATDRAALLGLGVGTRLRWQGSLQWLESRVVDPAPPTGAAYDAYTHGAGATGGVEYADAVSVAGWRGRVAVGVEGRGDRFGGDGVQPGSSFTQVSLRTSGALQRGDRTIWSLAPAVRLDGWTGSTAPRASLRLDAGVSRGGSSATLALGGGVTAPVLADLLFREGVGVRLNPELRPERVPWEIEAGFRQELAGGRGAAAIRGFYGRIEDMIVWAPDFRFIWSPRNFDVRRGGGELTLLFRPTRAVAARGVRELRGRHLRPARRRPGAVSPSGHVCRVRRDGPPAPGPSTCAGAASGGASPTRRAPIRDRRSPCSTSRSSAGSPPRSRRGPRRATWPMPARNSSRGIPRRDEPSPLHLELTLP